MIDPKLLRQAATDVAANLSRRGFVFDAAAYLALEERRKTLQVDAEQLRSERNSSAKSIGKAKAQGDNVEPLLAAIKDLGDRLDTADSALQAVQSDLQSIELGLPNLLQDDVPDGVKEPPLAASSGSARPSTRARPQPAAAGPPSPILKARW